MDFAGKWVALSLWQAGWSPGLVLAVHTLAVVAFDGYRRVPSLDVAMHFAGGVAIAWFFHRTSINASRYGVIGEFHPVTHVVLVGSLVCVAALVWEFAEFVLDRLFGTHYQPGLADTMVDLLLGMIGGAALVAAVVLTGGPSRAARELRERDAFDRRHSHPDD